MSKWSWDDDRAQADLLLWPGFEPAHFEHYHSAAQSFRPCQGYSSVDFSDVYHSSYELCGSYVPTIAHFWTIPTFDPGGVRTHVGQMVNL